MSGNLIILTGIIYAYVGVDMFLQNNMGMSVAYFAYALANVGMYMVAMKG
jgi:hypothetical protein